MLLERAEQIELKGDARMARGHHRMGHELAGVGAAIMAIEAIVGAGLRLVERDQPIGHIVRVAAGHFVMRCQPA